MADIFISYKREELTRAAQVAQALSEEGFSAFYDLHQDGIHAGEQWDRRLEAELHAAGCCIVLWSAASVESDHVRSEARRAHERRVLVPARIGKCTPPIGLDVLQEADLRKWRGDRSDPQWRYLIDRGVARILGRPGRPPQPDPELPATPVAAAPKPARPSKPAQPQKAANPASYVLGLLLTAGVAAIAVFGWQAWQSSSLETEGSFALSSPARAAEKPRLASTTVPEPEPAEESPPEVRDTPVTALFGEWQSPSEGCPGLQFSQGSTSERVIIKYRRQLYGDRMWTIAIGIDNYREGDPLTRVGPAQFRTTTLANDYDIVLDEDVLRIVQPRESDWLGTSAWADCEWRRRGS